MFGKSQTVTATEAGYSQSAAFKDINGEFSARQKCCRKRYTANRYYLWS